MCNIRRNMIEIIGHAVKNKRLKLNSRLHVLSQVTVQFSSSFHANYVLLCIHMPPIADLHRMHGVDSGEGREGG